jgi:hypothetical protein
MFHRFPSHGTGTYADVDDSVIQARKELDRELERRSEMFVEMKIQIAVPWAMY